MKALLSRIHNNHITALKKWQEKAASEEAAWGGIIENE